jgi:hypothetical protein
LSYEFLDQNGNLATLDCTHVNISGTSVYPGVGSASYTLRLPPNVPAATSFVTATVSGSVASLAFSSQANYITKPMQAAVGQQIQASASSYSNNTGSAANLSDPITITTTGRPVMLGVNGSAVGSSIQLLASGNGPMGAVIWFEISGGASASVGFQDIETTGTNTEYFAIPSSSMSYLYTPAAGTYTIKIQGYVKTGGAYVSANLSLQAIKIYAYEL